VFTKIQSAVTQKFGNDTTSSIELDFLFFKFICPSIIEPGRQDLIPDDTPLGKHTMKNLVLVSKILNDITHDSHEKYQENSLLPLQECVKRGYARVLEGVSVLLVRYFVLSTNIKESKEDCKGQSYTRAFYYRNGVHYRRKESRRVPTEIAP
jgi:hypothetical protein